MDKAETRRQLFESFAARFKGSLPAPEVRQIFNAYVKAGHVALDHRGKAVLIEKRKGPLH